ncbi:MAG: DUF128 domain-containing protein [Dehalococcoidia bacterium]|nr:DUF128 domain-containing protein [Dehalococcoidia bacterium]
MGFETQDVEVKLLSIMRILNGSLRPLGARIVSRRLEEHGIKLTERTVRYHLKRMDERGLTRLVGQRGGRVLTMEGIEEVKRALVRDKVGFVVSKIEILSFRTNFDLQNHTGSVPVNVSFFRKEEFSKALHVMSPAFTRGFCVSNMVAVAKENESLGGITIPQGKVGLATVCSVVVNGVLLKAGIPIESKFGGILQVRTRQPLRFVELIHYAGSSLDPSEIFIKAEMTSVKRAITSGNGEILANFREIPAFCRPLTEEVITKLKEAGIRGVLVMGDVSEPVCEVSVGLNQIGIVLLGGLNPIAVANEGGINTENHAMSTVLDYQDLVKFEEL